MAIFLESIFYVEEQFGIDTEQPHSDLQNAVDAIGSIPDVCEIQYIKEILGEYIKYARQHPIETGYINITPAESVKPQQGKFKDIESFTVEFLKYATPVLKQKEIPDFEFGFYSNDYFISMIHRVAKSIFVYYDGKVKISIGSLLEDLHILSSYFERSHHELFYPDIMSNELRRHELKKSKMMQALKNNKNCEVWQQYNVIKASNPNFSDSRIAKKIFRSERIFKTEETIKVCIKDGKRISREIENDPVLKKDILGTGADLNALPQDVC